MKPFSYTSSILLMTLAIEIAAPAMPAMASGSSTPAPADNGSPCAISNELSEKEQYNYLMFNARLSHLLDHFGKPTFEAKLKEIVEGGWPRTKMIQVSPIYFERLQNLVDQQRLKDSIARTIGLDSKEWAGFESQMRGISLHSGTGNDLNNPFDKVSIQLLKAIGRYGWPSESKLTREEKEVIRAEALARVSTMHAFLQRWRVLNGEIIDQRAEASAKTVAMVAIGLVGAGVLASTLVISAPIVGAAGTYAATLSTNPLVASLLVKTAETAAGAAIGFYGAPGATLVQDSYHAISEANKRSANGQTVLACELGKTGDQWRQIAGGKLLSSALTGASMGLAGGALTFTAASAKVVLWGTGFGVGVAQLYAIGKLGQTALESLNYYKLAEESEDAGNHALAVEQLKKARDLAQEAGEHGLESIIIGALSYHVATHFRHALHEGESAIRQLYAASADTIPTAERAAEKTIQAVAATARASAVAGQELSSQKNK